VFFQHRLKSLVERLPESVGRPLARIPFALRLGPAYLKSCSDIERAERVSAAKLETEVVGQLRALLAYAYRHVEFYRDLYRARGIVVEDVRTLADWKCLPVVTKADLQAIPLEDRCARGVGGLKVNTGGTSGQPLEFLLDRQAFAREWAHMHRIWKSRGYRPEHLKLTFRGKHFERSSPLAYNAVHNEFVVNASCPMADVSDAVIGQILHKQIRWLHGYPSLIAEFGHAMMKHSMADQAEFRSRLLGVLLGSEAPVPVYLSVIEKRFSRNVVSWYGHSEMAILARETAAGIYESMASYGYAETEPGCSGDAQRLICTSLHNRAHPFIRYDTGDVVEPVSERACSIAFRVTEGRVGDFVTDRRGNRHSLTAIIFGRHHPAFERLRHLQIRDDGQGRIMLLATPIGTAVSADDLWQGFDLSDLDMDFRLTIIAEPIRTSAGKILLKVR